MDIYYSKKKESVNHPANANAKAESLTFRLVKNLSGGRTFTQSELKTHQINETISYL